MSMKKWTLSTDDTTLKLEIKDNQLYITALYGESRHNWAPTRVHLPLRFAVGGEKLIADWQYVSAAESKVEDGTTLTLTFHEEAGLTLRSVWTYAPGPGAVQHQLFLDNATGKEVVIYNPESLHITLGSEEKTEVFYVHKDRAAAEIIAYMRSGHGTYLEPLTDRYKAELWTKPDDDDTGFIPLMMLHTEHNHGLYIGWVWNHGRIAVRGFKDGYTKAEIRAGLYDNFGTTIQPDETFDIPAAFIGTFEGDIDDGSNRLRKWLFLHMMPAINRENEKLPYVNWNAFHNTAIHFNEWVCEESKYYPMIDSIAKIGVEEVTIDVGWWERYGDWRSSSKYWPKGMRAASDYAHDKGMDFNLYFTFTNKGSEDENALTSEGPNAHPEWFIDNLKADFGADAAREFITRQLDNRFDEYRVEGLRTDYDPIVTRKSGANTRQGVNDGAYWAEKGYLQMLDHFYATRPGFRYQNCSGGGAMKGYAVMKRSCNIQVTDLFDAINQRKAVWDSAYCFPMMQIMNQFGDIPSGGKIGNATYRFRTYLLASPSAHIELPDEMPEEEFLLLKRLVEVYKERIRPLVRYANVYHNLPRCDGHVWDGLEYYDPNTGKGLTAVFKPDSELNSLRITWKGLEKDASYRVTFCDGTNDDLTLTGAELMEGGHLVTLPEKYTAEWIFIDRI